MQNGSSTIYNSSSAKHKQNDSIDNTHLIDVISLLSPHDMTKQCKSENLNSTITLFTKILEILSSNTNTLENAIALVANSQTPQ